LTKLETNQAKPRLARSWATLSPVAGGLLRRVVGSVSYPSFLPTTRYTRPHLPSDGSLGSHFPIFIGTMFGYDYHLSFSMPYAFARSSIPCLFLTFVSFLQARQRSGTFALTPGLLGLSRYAFSGFLTRKQMVLSSSQATPLSTCPALRPRWCPWYSPFHIRDCCLPSQWRRRLSRL